MSKAGKGTIRYEDLGGPIQRLLKARNTDVSDEDMALLEYVSVKDMAKIYSEMSSDRGAEVIWQELRNALIARREKARLKEEELARRAAELSGEAESLEKRRAEEEEAARLEAEREEAERAEREARRAARRAAKAAAAAAAAEASAEADTEAIRQAEEDAARAAEAEEAERAAAKAARKEQKEKERRRREAKERQLQEEQESLAAERSKLEGKRGGQNQAQQWDDYVKSHPLEFCAASDHQEIEQVRVTHELKAPPRASEELLNRMYTPKCPNCNAKFSKPPKDWDCPMCLRRYRQQYKTWQPDDHPTCMVCKCSVGRFSRHHCRNCGRVVCAGCSPGKARIPALGFDEPTRVCTQCVEALSKPAAQSAE